jgi:HEAT repeats
LGAQAEKWQSLPVPCAANRFGLPNPWLGACRALVTACFLALPSSALASDGPRRVDALAELRAAADDTARLAALHRLGQTKPAQAATAIEALLRDGQTDPVTDAAVEALGLLAAPESRPLLEELCRHRRAAVRLQAYAALAKLRGPGNAIDDAVALGLRDGSADVRALVTRLLADRGAFGTLDRLWRALERGVPEAATAIGRLGKEPDFTRLATHLGTVPLDAMLTAYLAVLCRPDVSTPAKLQAIAVLENTSGDAVHAFLVALEDRRDCVLDAKTRAVAHEAALRTRAKPATRATAKEPAK